MLTQERHEKIIDLVNQQGAVGVMDLVTLLDTSESTIRRDLAVLDKKGHIKKVYGGATSVNHGFISSEDDVNTKMHQNLEAKVLIAQYAASTIADDDVVYIDAGSTTELMIDYITCKKATYVTNGIAHAKKLIGKGLKVYIIGGYVKPATEAIIGAESVSSLEKYNFTKAFMGVNGIDVKHGYTTVDVEEAAVKKAAIKQAYITYMLADHTKFDKYTAVQFAPIEKCCIVTDCKVHTKYKNATMIKEVKEG